LFSVQQQLWADHHLIIFVGIFINETSIGLQRLGRGISNATQQQALVVAVMKKI
jgi:hypothetical protein